MYLDIHINVFLDFVTFYIINGWKFNTWILTNIFCKYIMNSQDILNEILSVSTDSIHAISNEEFKDWKVVLDYLKP